MPTHKQKKVKEIVYKGFGLASVDSGNIRYNERNGQLLIYKSKDDAYGDRINFRHPSKVIPCTITFKPKK